jgi:hypothetical protein
MLECAGALRQLVLGVGHHRHAALSDLKRSAGGSRGRSSCLRRGTPRRPNLREVVKGESDLRDYDEVYRTDF